MGPNCFVDEDGSNLGSLGAKDFDEAVAQRASAFLESNGKTWPWSELRNLRLSSAEFADVQLLFERIQREPRLVICGAGHVGAALANLASLLGYQSTLIDDRSEFVTRERFPDERIDLVAATIGLTQCETLFPTGAEFQ